ncbi:ATP-binding protein [Mycobacterium sp. TNTM28]|uniref:ATP-binding protein n=1 Tax=[Mycobacterium] fortunisiensis TaxID=2600579 RepID=A0ABS6KIL6_9MYCO|nr:ATP-binding protein [[Mycobacterium] fortunisiensis]MBU9763354.1 ATP-binding protein [[Mycobacterium] fortunisiensis]
MDPLDNPYTPNAGATPPVVVGRDDQQRSFDLLLARLEKGRTEQSMIITGLRGVGKTVLLREFHKKAAARKWATIDVEISKHDNDDFRRQLAREFRSALLRISPKARWGDRAKHVAAVIKSFTIAIDPDGRITAGLDTDVAEGVADSGDLVVDLSELLIALGEAAKEHHTGVVLLFDEIQFLAREQLEAVVAAIHKTVQLQLPITMVGAGLPQIAELAGEAKSYAERLFKFPEIGILAKNEAYAALREPATDEGAEFEDGALELAAEVTGRYPYFIQELGYAVWPLASGNRITRSDVANAQQVYEEKLDSSFFRVRLDRATELEQAYLRAMAELGPEPQLAGDVARLLNRSSQQCAPTRSTLIEKGLLYTPSHGYAAFTVPHFDQFMRRSVPDLSVPPVRPRRKRS